MIDLRSLHSSSRGSQAFAGSRPGRHSQSSQLQPRWQSLWLTHSHRGTAGVADIKMMVWETLHFLGGDKERDRVQCSVLCCLIHIIKVHLCLAPPTPSPPTHRGVTVASHHNHHLHFSNQIWRRPTNAQIKIF